MTLSRQPKLDAIAHGPDTIVAILDARARIEWVSPNVTEMLGLDPSELVSQDAAALVHPDDVRVASLMVLGLLDTPGASCRLRVRAVDLAHGWRWMSTTVTNRFDDPDVSAVVIELSPSVDRAGDENPLAPLFRPSSEIVLLVDAERRITYVSPSSIDVLGWTPDEFIERYVDLIHPDELADSIEFATQLLSQPRTLLARPGRVLHADGTYRNFESRAVNLLDDPDYGAIHIVMHDVTPLPDAGPAESTLDRFRETVARAADPVLVLDAAGQVIYTSAALADLMHEPASHFVGRTSRDLVHSDDLRPLNQAYRSLVDGDDDSVTSRLRLLRDDGTTVWVEARLSLFRQDDEPNGVLAIVRNINDQVLAEEALQASESRFRALVQNAPDCIMVFDGDRRATYASPSVLPLVGFAPEQVIGEEISAGVHADDRAALDDAWERACSDPTSAPRLRARVLDSTGSWRWLESTIQDHRDNPEVGGVVVNFRDVGEQMGAEAALEARERRFRTLVHHSFEVTAVVTPDLQLTWISPSVEGLTGWRSEDILHKNVLDYLHREDQKLAVDHLALVLDGHEPRPNTTIRVRCTDGSWRPLDVSASDRTSDPEIGGLIINMRDATERVAAEQALQKSERRFRRLVQNSTDVVQIMNERGDVTWVSPAIESVLGYRVDEVVGAPNGGMDELTGRTQAFAAFAEVLDEPGHTARTACSVRHADGSMRWIDLVLVNHLDDPDIAGIVATYRDITERVEMEDARRESEERFRSLADSSPSGIFQFDLAGNCTYVNGRWCEITGYEADDAMGHGWQRILLPSQPHHQPVAGTGATGTDVADPLAALGPRGRFRRADGQVRWADIRTASLTDDKGNRVGTVGTIDDVTDRVDMQHESEMLTTILESTPDLVGISGRDGELLYLNEAARSFFGLAPDAELELAKLRELIPIDTFHRWDEEVSPALKARDTWQGELTLIDQEGRTIPVSAVFVAHRGPDGTIEQVSVNARDISDRKALEERLEHQATHDPLTSLPNRTLLLDRLEMAIGRAHRQSRHLAVLFLDLDHFKVVNDSLGHSVGDELLAAVAQRLSEQLRPGDTVARFGGDEFVVVCEDLSSLDEAEIIANRISDAVAQPMWIGNSEVLVTASVGIAVASDLHQTPEQLLRDADAAMYQAKARGRSRHEVFDSRLRTRAIDRLEVESALRRALVRHELRVHYQPTFDLRTGEVTSVEALLRWEHPQRGLLLPAEFLRVAEESGLIVPLGAWVLRQACRQIQRLRVEVPGHERLQVAVNLSARQISHPFLVDELAKLLTDTATTPDSLVLEITESVLMDDIPANAATLRRLKELGVRLAIDDFGTGYSSLAYLRRFPVDILKVDRSFVSGLGDDPEDAAIANAVITLGHTLGLVTIAEGVETPEQRDELLRLGCDQAQGFLMGRPMNAADLADFLVR